MRTGRGARAAVTAASAVLGVCLAGAPLYVSSAASESVQVQLSSMCLADAGLVVYLQPAGSLTFAGAPVETVERRLEESAAATPHLGEPIVTSISDALIYDAAPGEPSPVGPTLLLMARDGQLDHLDVDTAALGPGEALVPVWNADAFLSDQGAFEVRVPSESLVLDPVTGDRATDQARWVPLQAVGTYPDVPVRPEPSYWCGWRDLFRPSGQGDRPRPVVFVDEATMDRVATNRVWEVRPEPDGLTRADARALVAALAQMSDRYQRALGFGGDGELVSQLPTVIARAEGQSQLVDRTIAPIRWGGLATAAGLLVASGAMLARERRRDLRLRLLRGVGPFRIAGRVGLEQALVVLAGTAIGVGLAVAGVRTLGPTPELEPGPVRHALVSAAVGAALALTLVAVVAAAATARTVDARPARRRGFVPWELPLVVLAVASYLRLDRVGGVRLSGSSARGGDLLAQAFPLLALAAPLALLVRPLIALARRTARAGRHLPVALLVGLRRIAHEPASFVLLTVATALAAGSFVVAGSLTASADRLLADKAETFLGADLVVRTRELERVPPALDGRATVVARAKGRTATGSVELLGIERSTFADAVRWRRDAADLDLDELLELLDPAAPGSVPAIVVGASPAPPEARIEVSVGDVGLTIAPVAEARWFPGYHNGTTLVVVDRAVVERATADPTGARLVPAVWVKDPPPEATSLIAGQGATVVDVDAAADVFDATSYLAVRWSYAALGAFGILVGAAGLLAQLLVLDAGRRPRQATWTLTSRMGLRARGEAATLLTELGLPLGLGGVLGFGLGTIVLHVAVPKFDTLRQLLPPASVVVDLGAMATSMAVAVASLGALVGLWLVTIRLTRPIEVMRGGN